ncbi:MAG: 8-oxo-dGTP diphosphatase [Actinomycetota bacterium]|nr:8-oxo-dGTP diphosphatase [Actinomycetota bacterium]
MPARHDARGDGDGWVECHLGHRHWGRFGAAGVLLHRRLDDVGSGDSSRENVLLQHRAEWSHHGGTWGLPGGARASTETPVAAALREAKEEADVPADRVRVDATYVDDHGGWSYTTVLAATTQPVEVRATGGESIDVAWHPTDTLESLELHPGFAATWPHLRTALGRLTVVVDAANVVGSRPDGWWRDRAGAAGRLLRAALPLAAGGVAGSRLPAGTAPDLDRWWPDVVVVLEGAARAAAPPAPAEGLRVVHAPASGDDTIVTVTGAAAKAGPVLVVTADRGLRDRVTAVGAGVAGPRWWHDLVDGQDR